MVKEKPVNSNTNTQTHRKWGMPMNHWHLCNKQDKGQTFLDSLFKWILYSK